MVTESAQALPRSGRPARPDDVPEGALLRYPHLRGFTLVFVLMGIMMHTVDATIANVALPHIQGTLSATIDQISWVLTGYIVAAAVATPAVAWLSARFGVRTVMLISVACFTSSSTLCGLATTLTELVFFRVLQGFTGAALIPVGQSILLSCFKPQDTPRAMGIFGLGVMLGPIIGPTLGGYITEWSNWRWVFFINLPLGLMAMAGLWFLVKNTAPNKTRALDGIGLLSLVTAMASFQLLMDRGHGEDWFDSWEIILWALLALVGLYIFVVRTATARQPLFDRRLFVDRNFVVGNFVFFFVSGNMVATMVMVPVIMQSMLGYPVATAGLLLAPRGLGMMLSMALIPRVSHHFDPRFIITMGIIITAFALYLQGQIGTYFSASDFIRTGFLHGVGLGMIFVLLGSLSFSHMGADIRLQASTFFNMVRNIGQSFFAATIMSNLARNIQINTSELGESITGMGRASRLALADMPPLPNQEIALSILHAGIVKQASFISYINNFYALAVITLCLIPFVWMTRNLKISTS